MATRTRYAPDRGLTVRMTATMFLLGLVFVAFVALIIGIMTAAHASAAAIILVALVFGGGSAFISLFYSDKIALAAAGAREVSPQRGAGAARHRGPALRARGHGQAPGRDRPHPAAERLRDRPQQQELGAVRHRGPAEPAAG